MSYVNEVSGVSMRDVLDAMVACHDDQGAQVRIVLYVVRPEKAKVHIRVVAQACNATGAPVQGLPLVAQPWPHPEFRTLTAMFHFLVSRVYESLEYHRYLRAQKERDSEV